MGNVNADLNVGGVGASHGFEVLVNEEKLGGFGSGGQNLPIGNTACIFKYINYSVSHANLTLTFNAGPPSETRTHSL